VRARWLPALIEAQRPHLALWVPVLFATGIGVYFRVPAEPGLLVLAAIAAAAAIGCCAARHAGTVARVALLVLLLPALGFAAAALRSRMVAAPVLPYPMTASVEGRLIGLDRSASDRPRVLLDQVLIHGLDPSRTPARVRISVDPSTPGDVLQPGLRLLGQARLSPPPAPAEPGGFDFRRMAWFERLGAVGYARTPMLETMGSDRVGRHQLAFRIRMAASAHIRRLVPGQNGAFAAAILTGDRSGIDRAVEADLRASNLYHLVSISGLHMTLLAASVFVIIRYGLALIPRLALTWPLKKIAAWVALAGGAVYLFVSGAEVPTQRAFVMTAVMLIAVLLDRPAITMRSVALAALIVLAVAPESLVQAGFQMSFAATIALIAAFDALRSWGWWQRTQTEPAWRFARPLIAVAVTSFVAGTATAPFAAFHFNTLSQYGFLANLLAVPAMGIVVMPAAVVGALAAPLGLDWLPLQAAAWGIGYILAVARFVAGLGGALVGVPAGPGASLALVAIGCLVLALWRGAGRVAGLAPLALGALLWAGHERPDILVAETGRLFGIRTEAGRILSSGRGNGFAASSWLENDGDRASQVEAHARADLVRRRHRIETEVSGVGRLLYVGTKDAATAEADCAAAAILIAPNWTSQPEGRCLFIGRARLRSEGALAIDRTPGGLRVEGALARDRRRPWSGRQGPPGTGTRVARQ
jgi:competence protein ComEC